MKGPIFRPRARIMKTLGEELISSDSVALIELVKNAYDADASEVVIKIVGPLKEKEGVIQVFDNGSGMSLHTIENSWMEPATSSKLNQKLSPSGRRVLGEKGIGRFAASRLSSMLELVSRRAGENSETLAIFDWSQFEDDQKFLDEVEVLIESKPPTDITSSSVIASLLKIDAANPQGTILSMTGLKRVWNNSSFDEIQRGLSRLVSPFTELPDFKITVSAPVGFEQYNMEIQPPAIINYPHYTVEGEVFEGGEYAITYNVLSIDKPETVAGQIVRHPKSGWVMKDGSVDTQVAVGPSCGPLKIQLRIWDRDELGNISQMTGGTISSARKDLDFFAGISIYRDGFRVMPYGEPNNDWLRLDLRRVQKPTYRVSNNQIVGYISISADGNPGLKDQSNREGMRESQAYADLKDVMFCVLAKIEEIRFKARKSRSGTPASGSDSAQIGLFDPIDLSGIRNHMSQQHPQDALAKKLIDNLETEFDARIENVKNVLAKYSGLATLGKLVDAVLHEGRQPLASISGQASLGNEDLEDSGFLKHDKILSASKRFDKIKTQSQVLSLIFKRIEPFGGRKVGRPPQLYIEMVIKESFDIFESQLSELSIHYSISNTQTLVKLDPHEIQQIFVNLIDNSIYWLQMVGEQDREILVEVSRTLEGFVEIVFSDSGPGIPEESRESIFDAYYSNRKDGAGLGLSIVGEMVSNYYGGTLELLSQGALPGASFRIRLCKRV